MSSRLGDRLNDLSWLSLPESSETDRDLEPFFDLGERPLDGDLDFDLLDLLLLLPDLQIMKFR